MLTNFLALALVTVIAAVPTQLAARATKVYKIHLNGDAKNCRCAYPTIRGPFLKKILFLYSRLTGSLQLRLQWLCYSTANGSTAVPR
jgi:hypothetical protein